VAVTDRVLRGLRRCGEAARAEIVAATGNASVEVLLVDLAQQWRDQKTESGEQQQLRPELTVHELLLEKKECGF